jgi:DNA-binding transcriptional regulator/RsmH inhibitor MraZ
MFLSKIVLVVDNKTRLMLPSALSRAKQRHRQILILDEPDRGLPSETTFHIMLNIVH